MNIVNLLTTMSMNIIYLIHNSRPCAESSGAGVQYHLCYQARRQGESEGSLSTPLLSQV